jgi:hypothetical protein
MTLAAFQAALEDVFERVAGGARAVQPLPDSGREISVRRQPQFCEEAIAHVDQHRREQLVIVATTFLIALAQRTAVVGRVVVIDQRRADFDPTRDDIDRRVPQNGFENALGRRAGGMGYVPGESPVSGRVQIAVGPAISRLIS